MAGRIPTSFIDDLINRVDIVEVIDARVPLKKAGREYTACCPFHNEKTPSFTVSPSKQFYHCFGCGAHGTAIGFLMEYEHMEFPEAVEELARMVGVDVPHEGGDAPARPAEQKAKADWYELMAQADRFYRRQLRQHPQASRAVEYLKQRGLSGEVAARYALGFAPPGWDNLLRELGKDDHRQAELARLGMLIKKDSGGYYDRFRDRIMFPIRDSRGRTIAFGGRVISPDDTPKYLNSPETPLFHKGRELYGLYEARKALRDIPRLLVVEGYMDVVALAQFDINYAVATLGTATTADHLNRLFRISEEVVFCFDGDRAGREAAWRALEHALPVLREGRTIRFMFLPEGEDPDSLVRKEGKEGFEAQVARAEPLSDYFFKRLQTDIDMGSLDGRARLVDAAKPLLAKLPGGVYKQMMLDDLARRAQLERDQLEGYMPADQPAAQPGRQAKRPAGEAKAVPSLVRRGVKLLLHHPGLAAQVGDLEPLRGLNLAGMPLFVELVELLRENPQLSPAAIFTRLEASPYRPHIEKLLQEEQLIDTEALEPEFVGVLEAMARLSREQRWDALYNKPFSALSEAEKAELRRLQQELQKSL
jgi:DNA primase